MSRYSFEAATFEGSHHGQRSSVYAKADWRTIEHHTLPVDVPGSVAALQEMLVTLAKAA